MVSVSCPAPTKAFVPADIRNILSRNEQLQANLTPTDRTRGQVQTAQVSSFRQISLGGQLIQLPGSPHYKPLTDHHIKLPTSLPLHKFWPSSASLDTPGITREFVPGYLIANDTTPHYKTNTPARIAIPHLPQQDGRVKRLVFDYDKYKRSLEGDTLQTLISQVEVFVDPPLQSVERGLSVLYRPGDSDLLQDRQRTAWCLVYGFHKAIPYVDELWRLYPSWPPRPKVVHTAGATYNSAGQQHWYQNTVLSQSSGWKNLNAQIPVRVIEGEGPDQLAYRRLLALCVMVGFSSYEENLYIVEVSKTYLGTQGYYNADKRWELPPRSYLKYFFCVPSRTLANARFGADTVFL